MSENNFIKSSDSNLVPEKVITSYGNDGSKHTSFVYSLETWATFNLFSIFAILAFMLTLIPIVSAIFLIFLLLRIDAKPLPNSHNFFGGLAALYLLIDYHNGWLISRLIGCFFSYQYQYWMLYGNLALLFTHTFLFFLGDNIVAITKTKVGSILIIILLVILSLITSRILIDNNFISFIVKSIE